MNNGRLYGAAAAVPADATFPTLFDGARIIPETPTGGTNAGISSPYREQLGYWFYSQMGVLSPWADFFRTINLSETGVPLQRRQLVFQQANERFLEMNGRIQAAICTNWTAGPIPAGRSIPIWLRETQVSTPC